MTLKSGVLILLGVFLRWQRIMVGLSVGSPDLFHFCFVQVPFPVDKYFAGPSFSFLELRVISIVVLFHYLKCPTSANNVPAHDISANLIGYFWMPCLAQEVDCVSQRQIRLARQAVEAVEQAPGMLDYFHRFGELTHGIHRLITDTLHALMRIIWAIMII